MRHHYNVATGPAHTGFLETNAIARVPFLNVKLIWCIVRVAKALSLFRELCDVHYGCFGRSHPIVASHLPLLLRAAPMPSQPLAASRNEGCRHPSLRHPLRRRAPASPCTVTPGTALRYFLQSNSSPRGAGRERRGATGTAPHRWLRIFRRWATCPSPANKSCIRGTSWYPGPIRQVFAFCLMASPRVPKFTHRPAEPEYCTQSRRRASSREPPTHFAPRLGNKGGAAPSPASTARRSTGRRSRRP